MTETSRLLQLRAKFKRNRPKFIRQESWRYKRVKPSWRKVRGIDNKARRKKKGTIKSPNIGYKSPNKVRYLHPSGYKEVIIHNLAELEKVDNKTSVAKFAHNVGRHKRIMLQDRADQLDVLILNRTRILLPGEQMLMDEGRGFERETKLKEMPKFEEDLEEDEELTDELDTSEDAEE